MLKLSYIRKKVMQIKNYIFVEFDFDLYNLVDLGFYRVDGRSRCDIICFSDNTNIKDESMLLEDSHKFNETFETRYSVLG